MKKLVVVIHGKHRGVRPGKGHQESLGLTLKNSGVRQMQYIGGRLRDMFGGDCEPVILCSNKPQARESADIIADFFDAPVPVEESEVLYSDNETLDLPGILELIKAKEETTDVIILVTHQGAANELLAYFGKEELEAEITLKRKIKKGEGYIINCASKEVLIVEEEQLLK